MSATITSPELAALPELPPPGSGQEADVVDTLLCALEGVASSRAYLDSVEVTITELLVTHVQNAAVSQLLVRRLDAPPTSIAAERVDARSALADELALTTGAPPGSQRDIVEFAAAPPSRTSALRAAMAEGVVGFSRVRSVWRDTSELPDAAVQTIAAATLAPGPDGRLASHQVFRRRLSRLVATHTGEERRRRRTRERRTCTVDTWADGGATLAFTGPSESLVGAYERVDALARTLRSSGDPRTLAQLRFDIGAGLLCHGQPTRTPTPSTSPPVASRPPNSHRAAMHPAASPPTGSSSEITSTREGAGARLTSPRPEGHTEAPAGRLSESTRTATAQAQAQAQQFAVQFDDAFPAVPLPTASVTVVVSAASLLGLNDDPGEVPGHGFLPALAVRDMAHEAGSTWRRLVTDPVTGYAMAASSPTYRPPMRMVRAVRDRDGTCRFPGCVHPPARCDLDHVDTYPVGATAGTNLQTLHRRHHQHKTRSTWRARMSDDGTVTWVTPLGRVHTTTPLDYRTDFGAGPTSDVDCGHSSSDDSSASRGSSGTSRRASGDRPPDSGSRTSRRASGGRRPTPGWSRANPGPPPF